MNAIAKIEVATLSIMTIEEGLAELCKFGNAGLSRLDRGGWHCVLKMFVSGEGVSFDVRSNFNHGSPIEAVRTCYDRMNATLIQLGKPKGEFTSATLDAGK
jgi:hypothetical protein